MLANVEDQGSAYFPQVNAFYVREFHMMQAAEDGARFLHHACRALPKRLNGHGANGNGPHAHAGLAPLDSFYAQVVEDAVAYFGSRVLHPARPLPESESAPTLSRAAIEKAAQTAIRADVEEFESISREWGYRIGDQIYAAYLAGKVTPAGLRRLFLAHLDAPWLARRVCMAVIAKLRSAARS